MSRDRHSALLHPTAVIDPEARISPTARVGPFSIIEKNVTIGDGTEIGARCRLYAGTTIGARCRIGDFAVIGAPPQSISFDLSVPTFVEIGDGTEVGEYASIHRATTESYHTRIGRECRIRAYAHVAHDGHLGHAVILGERVQLGGHVQIDDHAELAPGLPVHQFTRIGRCSRLESGARKDVPPFALYVGRAGDFDGVVEGVNWEGLERGGFGAEALGAIERAYDILYDSGMNISQAAEAIARELAASPEAAEIAAFLAASKRGLARGGKR